MERFFAYFFFTKLVLGRIAIKIVRGSFIINFIKIISFAIIKIIIDVVVIIKIVVNYFMTTMLLFVDFINFIVAIVIIKIGIITNFVVIINIIAIVVTKLVIVKLVVMCKNQLGNLVVLFISKYASYCYFCLTISHFGKEGIIVSFMLVLLGLS